ncbi:MAG: ankyrin repeat domain-containing protein [Bdellovibrionales bacterium]|nr:ankyrin repeat domain-containing protein [Bdellovibrionales bacterium]
MKLLFAFLTVFLMGCNMHESTSTVLELEKLQRADLEKTEVLQKAYLEEDYEHLQNELASGTDVDLIFASGKTLLYMAIQAENFKMVDFLLGFGANPQLQLTVNKKVTTPLESCEDLTGLETQKVMKAVLQGQIADQSLYLFKKHFLKLSTGERADLVWINKLVGYGLDWTLFTESDFQTFFFNKIPATENSQEIFRFIFFETHSLLPTDQWLEWVESPFSTGRYKRANCSFVSQRQCFQFSEFLLTCEERYRSQLSRAQNQLEKYIVMRNHLLRCS